MRIALVHDWLNGMRGGEKCLDSLCQLFPTADIFTLFHSPGKVSAAIESRKIQTSFLQHLPRSERYYRYLLPLYPYAIEAMDLEAYDLVLSLSHCAAKGVRVPSHAKHVCYCFTPMRYLWDLYDVYFAPDRTGWATRTVLGLGREALRRWDLRTSDRVDRFVGISSHVVDRIHRIYGRRADLIYPPVETDFFRPPTPKPEREEFYLVVTAFAPYKRVELAIEAASRLGRELRIIGTGQDEARLKACAAACGGKIEFLGWTTDEELRDALARCRAVLYPGEEDFGIVPVEANAMGVPVIAFGRGGVTETIVPLLESEGASRGSSAPTGVFFFEPTSESLVDAIRFFERNEAHFRPVEIRARALRYDRRVFESVFLDYIEAVLSGGATRLSREGGSGDDVSAGIRDLAPVQGHRGWHASEAALAC